MTQFLHSALMLGAAPLLVGLIRLMRARLVGRAGPKLLQPYRDLRRLLRKQPVLADNASMVFRGAPAVNFAAIAAAAFLVPSFASGMALAPTADLLVIAGLLALARASLAIAAMDVGTAFGGLGASREMAFSVFAEPALLMIFLTLALLAGTTNLDMIAAEVRDGGLGLRVSMGLALLATIAVGLAENERVPAGNPETHLELTMVHEAMVLEYSGRYLALVEAGAAVKLLLWLTLIGTIFFPVGLAPSGSGPLLWLAGLVAWGVKIVVLAGGLALLETGVARMRLFRVPEFLAVALLLGILAALFLFVSQGMT
jgi:formate hydrogenlyase subunit 4